MMPEKLSVMVFGSCMSNLTANHLVADYGFEQTHSIHHNRSDSFIRNYIDGTDTMIPMDYLESHLHYKPETEAEARQFLRNQYPDHLGFHDLNHRRRPGKTFFDDIDEMKFDIVLLDNFMDIAAKLVYWKTNPEYVDRKIFLNIGFYSNEDSLAPQFWHDDYLDPTESVQNWIRIYHWIRARQAAAKIYFLPYHHCSSLTVPDRLDRIKSFDDRLSIAAHATGLRIFPALTVPSWLTNGEVDWPHFQPEIYKALAGALFLDYHSDCFSKV